MAGAKGKSGGKRAGAGRATFEPTGAQRRLVKKLASIGITQATICGFVKGANGKPISEPTLRKNFAVELDTGKIKANVKIAQTLYRKAIGDDTTSIIFWLKSQAGWKDVHRVEHTGGNGAPIQSVRMTPDEFREIARRIADEI